MSRDSACGLHWNILISAAPASLVALRWQMLIYAYSLPSGFVTSPWKYRSPLSSSRTRTPRESALVVTLPTIFRKAIRRALAAWRMRKIALQSTIARKKVSIRNWIGFLCTHISSQALFVGAKLWRFLYRGFRAFLPFSACGWHAKIIAQITIYVRRRIHR